MISFVSHLSPLIPNKLSLLFLNFWKQIILASSDGRGKLINILPSLSIKFQVKNMTSKLSHLLSLGSTWQVNKTFQNFDNLNVVSILDENVSIHSFHVIRKWFFLMLGNVFIEETFRLQENILLSSNNDANEQAHQTFRKKRISIKPLIKLWRFIFKMISKFFFF